VKIRQRDNWIRLASGAKGFDLEVPKGSIDQKWSLSIERGGSSLP
jgi:hypothetical protein